jgi:hypothetical protein
MKKNNNIIILILLLILILTIFIIAFINYENYENIENNETIVSNLEKNQGFFSQFFFLLNQYLYCKHNKKNFKINSENWLYKFKDGWTDYFEAIELNFYDNNSINKDMYHSNILGDFTINNYIEAINDVYKYNDITKIYIEETIEKLNLKNQQYSSIYIRRGDKLASESKIINEDEYLKILIDKNPHCNNLFVQTDDYNCVLNLQNYIDEKKLNIKIYTLCSNEQYGSITNNNYKNQLSNASHFDENKQYLSDNLNKIINNKSIEDMNNEEIKQHTLDLISGIDIVKNSDYCILDYQSNVSRFIKLFHNNPKNVINVNDANNDIDYDKKTCPAWGF